MINFGQEIHSLVVSRNRPMLTALEMCIEQFERLSSDDPDVQCAPAMRTESRRDGAAVSSVAVLMDL